MAKLDKFEGGFFMNPSTIRNWVLNILVTLNNYKITVVCPIVFIFRRIGLMIFGVAQNKPLETTTCT